MNDKNSRVLIQQYITGWKENNFQLIADCLTKNPVVIESQGPTYHGVKDIER